MTIELKNIIDYVIQNSNQNKFVLATVVHLEGSSYRRPGVRMLINNNGESFGNVSGGCVEKEVIRQSQSVFKSEIPKIIKYDGRFRLGCEGIITILIEPFSLSKKFITISVDPSNTYFQILNFLNLIIIFTKNIFFFVKNFT